MNKRKLLSYKRKSGLIFKKINNEFIVIDPKTDTFYTLNTSAEIIFRFIYKKRNFEEILYKLSREYKISPQKLKKDLKNFLAEISFKELVDVFPNQFSHTKQKENIK